MLRALFQDDESGVLVLDNAERLLSYEAKAAKGVNFLTQLWLLPRVLGLRLSIVVISQSVLLGQTRT